MAHGGLRSPKANLQGIAASVRAAGLFLRPIPMMERRTAWTWALACAGQDTPWAGLRWDERLELADLFDPRPELPDVGSAVRQRSQLSDMAGRRLTAPRHTPLATRSSMSKPWSSNAGRSLRSVSASPPTSAALRHPQLASTAVHVGPSAPSTPHLLARPDRPQEMEELGRPDTKDGSGSRRSGCRGLAARESGVEERERMEEGAFW